MIEYWTTNPCVSPVCEGGRQVALARAKGIEPSLHVVYYMGDAAEKKVIDAARKKRVLMPFWTDGKSFSKSIEPFASKPKPAPVEDSKPADAE